MATLLENLFVRHDKGEQEFIYELIRDMDDYLNEYRDRYSRPIVMRIYKYSSELFDSHSYPKGGLILNMLRSLLGEETFRKGLNKFLKKFEYSVADTEDFRKTMEEVSGKNLEWFFEQFFYNSGHPALKVEEEWKDDSKKLLIRIKQVQGDDSLNTYILPLKIQIKIGETIKEYAIDLNEREAVYVFDLDARPDYVCVDPFFEVFKTIEYQRTAEQWAKILLSDKHVYCKVLAARALGSIGDLRAVEALSQAMLKDDFWGVAAEAAKALGETRTEMAREALLSALSSVKHPKVRRAICDALGNYRDDRVCDALKKVLADVDESYYVRQSAAISLGKMRREDVYDYLLKFINEPSHNYAITIGVLRGLAEIGDERCLKTILEYSYEDKPNIVRSAAIMSLGKFPGRREVIKVLQEYSRDENYRVRQAVVAACKELMAPEVIPILEKMAENDLMEMVRRSARDAAEKIRKNLEKGVEYKALRDEIERIREENRRLAERISLLGRVPEHKA
jgi:aminopeptidase N